MSHQCPACKTWEIVPDDIFCSWCGAKLKGFKAWLNIPRIYSNGLGTDGEELKLYIKNNGAIGQIKIASVTPDQPWLHIDEFVSNYPLAKDAVLTLTLNVDLEQVGSGFQPAIVSVRTVDDDLEKTPFEVIPQPFSEILPSPLSYRLIVDGQDATTYRASLVETQSVVEVLSLRTGTDTPWAEVRHPKLPCVLDARTAQNKLEFELVFNEEKIRQSGVKFPQRLTGLIYAKFDKLGEERDYPFTLECSLAPELQLEEASGGFARVDAFSHKQKAFHLTLRNGDKNDTTRMELLLDDIRIAEDAAWLTTAVSGALPIKISSGQSFMLECLIASDSMPVGEHSTIITFSYQVGARVVQQRIEVLVNVTVMPDFRGALAIDFGTVNSCCATLYDLQALGQLTLIELDDPRLPQRTTLPSVIQYLNKDESGVRHYIVGQKAYDNSWIPREEPTTVRQVKRHLGKGIKKNITYRLDRRKTDELEPKEIVEDIVQRMLEGAEDQLGARIKQCIVSHPARFSLRQIGELKQAISACGIDVNDITTMMEPLGAALSYLNETVASYLKSDAPAQNTDYYMMVYDIGGGTTDIALLHVNSQYMPNKKTYFVTPDVMGSEGDPLFGGEDITTIVAELALKQFYDKLQDENPEVKVSIPHTDYNSGWDRQRTEKPGEGNRAGLRVAAEICKLALSELSAKEKDDEPYELVMALTVEFDGVPSGWTAHAFITANDLYEALKPKLDETIARMKKLVSIRGLKDEDIKVIVLSGKTAAFRFFKKLMEESFPGVKVANPADLKKCVVEGACHLSRDTPSKGVYLELPSNTHLNTTTARLGLKATVGTQETFSEIVGSGVPIPQQGLPCPIEGYVFGRNTRLHLYEHTGIDDAIYNNPYCSQLAVFNLSGKLSEWERKNGRMLTNTDMLEAELQLVVMPNQSVQIRAKIPNVDEEIEFEAEMTGY